MKRGYRTGSSSVQVVLLAGAMLGVSMLAYGVLRQDGAACRSNLKQYSLALLMYMQDYDEKLPPMRIPAQVHNRVYPYVKNRSVFSCPETGSNYLPNPALNYLPLAAVEWPAQMVMLRDAKPHTSPSGAKTWNVGFVDGHVAEEETEPVLGKPAPDPKPLTRLQRIDAELQQLRMMRIHTDRRIKQLEAERRKLRSRGARK